jgi:hypothetical protein
LNNVTAAKYGVDKAYLTTVFKNLQFQSYIFNLENYIQKNYILSFSGALINAYTINITDSSVPPKIYTCAVLDNLMEAICPNLNLTVAASPILNISLFIGTNLDPIATIAGPTWVD